MLKNNNYHSTVFAIEQIKTKENCIYFPVPYAAPLAFSSIARTFSCLSSDFSSAKISFPKFYTKLNKSIMLVKFRN